MFRAYWLMLEGFCMAKFKRHGKSSSFGHAVLLGRSRAWLAYGQHHGWKNPMLAVMKLKE